MYAGEVGCDQHEEMTDEAGAVDGGIVDVRSAVADQQCKA